MIDVGLSDAAIIVSLALRYGVPLRQLTHAVKRDPLGNCSLADRRRARSHLAAGSGAMMRRRRLMVSDPNIRMQLQLAGLRFMSSRARWLASEAKSIGLALKSGKMTSAEVDAKLEEIDALDLVYPELMRA